MAVLDEIHNQYPHLTGILLKFTEKHNLFWYAHAYTFLTRYSKDLMVQSVHFVSHNEKHFYLYILSAYPSHQWMW